MSSTVSMRKYRLVTGEVSIGDWADIVFTVTKLQLPWRTLAPKLALMNGDGTRVKYNANLVSVQLGGTRVCLIHTSLEYKRVYSG